MPVTAHVLRLQAEQLLAQAKVLDAFGEDNFPDDAIITWEQRFHHSEPYTYVALKVAERGWYLTGRDGAHPLVWEDLIAAHLAKAEPDSIWFANRFEQF